jgi:tyrosyl-tRNA synthetase
MEERRTEPDLRDAGAATVLVRVGLAESMREARRKIAEGALTVYAAGEERVVKDPNEKILQGESRVLRLGRRFLRVVPS